MDIAELIKKSGRSRREICERAQITKSRLSQIEASNGPVSVMLLPRLADALGVTPAELRPDLAELFNK